MDPTESRENPPEIEPRPARRFQLPGEYYSSPVTAKPLFPKWVPIGCGAVALAFIIILFIGGSLFSTGGFNNLLEFTLVRSQGEVDRMFASDVKPEQRAAFDTEMARLRANIKAGKVKLASLQPLLNSLQDAMSDKLVNASETEQMLAQARTLNVQADKVQSKAKASQAVP